MTSAARLEADARQAWVEWSDLAKFTRCTCCRGFRYCRRSPARRTLWLCLACWEFNR